MITIRMNDRHSDHILKVRWKRQKTSADARYIRAAAAWSNAARRRRRREIANLIAGRVPRRARFSLADVDLHEVGFRYPKFGRDIKQTIGRLKAQTRAVGRQPMVSANARPGDMRFASGSTNDVEDRPVRSGAIGNQWRACRVFADAIFAAASFARPAMNGR
jgi:hypothetical protein